MIVGYLGSGSENIWIGGSTNPRVFQANTLQDVSLPDHQQYMNHIEMNGQRVNSPVLQHDSICIWDGNQGAWVTAIPNYTYLAGFKDDFTGTGSDTPPGWTLKSGTKVDDSDPTKVALSHDTEIISDKTFDPSKGGSIRWKVDSSGQTAGREVQYSVYLYGEGGSILQFWFNVNHTGGESTIRLDGHWSPKSVMFPSHVPAPAEGHEGTLSWTSTDVRLKTTNGIDVSYPWTQLVGSTAANLSDFGNEAKVALRGRPGTAQNFDWVEVKESRAEDPIDAYFPHWTRPQKSSLIGTVDIPENYDVSFELKPLGIVSNWSSLFHVTANGNNSRIPAFWLHKGTTRLHAAPGSLTNDNPWWSSDALSVGEVARIRLVAYGSQVQLHINGQLANSWDNHQRTVHSGVNLYAGGPWYPAADAELRNLQITTSQAGDLL